VGRETNRQRRERQAASAREKAAAARAAARRQEQRRRAVAILSSVGVIALVGVVVAIIAINASGKNNVAGNRKPAAASVVRGITSVPAATFSQVGQGNAQLIQKAVNDPPLTSNGKPEFLFVGGEFCPYCAAERWSMVAALSRFGKFSNLSEVSSSSTDVYKNTPTLSFYKSTYTSKYVSLVALENEDRDRKQLEPLTQQQAALFTKYTRGFPFLYLGGKYVQLNAGFSPGDLAGMTQQQVVNQLSDPTSKVAKDILGEANVLTAMICKLTNNKPASVCQASDITSLQGNLNA
jgi:hypothetical protein